MRPFSVDFLQRGSYNINIYVFAGENMEKSKFEILRERHPSFTYKSYSIEDLGDRLRLSFEFSLENGSVFTPKTEILKSEFTNANDFNSPAGQRMVFSLGMVELVSYWKCACPPVVYIDCGHLDDWDIRWWKRLYFNGLGEFFYINGISADEDSFMSIKCRQEAKEYPTFEYHSNGGNLIPVGGGKDSAVTAELLRNHRENNLFITVNDQKARTDTVLTAGYGENRIIKTYRTIDRELLTLNSKGYLNGHTPFSAIVAFLSLYCAYLAGAENIILSNESSANDVNVKGTAVNHQYSKSFAFEEDFTEYVEKNIMNEIRYFSMLRPFNELQIAKYFAKNPKYLSVFRSCNKGSRENRWCGECAKCLFVFSMLAPFTDYDSLVEVFGGDLLNNGELTEDFDGLVGISGIKPFECVGTEGEICLALSLLAGKLQKEGRELPFLVKRFLNAQKGVDNTLLTEYNPRHNVPDEFLEEIKEMYEVVAQAD